MSFEERMAQGRMSIDAFSRLVEREKRECLRSPKAIFRTGSWPCPRAERASRAGRAGVGAGVGTDAGGETEAGTAGAQLVRSINDSLADAAFTMELGECDVEPGREREASGLLNGDTPSPPVPYTESPYNYSWCAFSDVDEEAHHEARMRGARRLGGTASARDRIGNPERIRARREAITGAAASSMPHAGEGRTPAHEYARAGGEEAAGCYGAQAGQSAAAADSEGDVRVTGAAAQDTNGITPTNIEDFIQDFGDGEEDGDVCKDSDTC
eukprot:Tamp_21866.p1 GENE.Tamp_21866~~Tamp_21866.p1  ORF type:complete len:308 (+),score=54.60 Tamp_21866:118-924(+)